MSRSIRILRVPFNVLLLFCLLPSLGLFAQEGMWLPDQLAKRERSMRAMGLKLRAEDLYSTSRASIKDAVVQFGRGCTGVLVSGDGLLLTNHHCGYSSIQSLSSVEHDYLQHGYGNRGQHEELPCPGLSVRIVEFMRDITAEVLSGVDDGSTNGEMRRSERVQANIAQSLRALREQDSTLQYEIKPLYYGNRYYLYAYRVFRDVRLVFAPPSCLGAFGGDTDNWIYPRHSSDFSLFRVYVDRDNRPAEYSAQNVPYTPKHYVQISAKGIKPGDFAMVYGFPGSTNRFLVSQGVEDVMVNSDPRKVALRDERLRVMSSFMGQSDTVRIQYASKYQGVANAWKKWQGEALGLRRLDAPSIRRAQESAFGRWVLNGDADRKKRYAGLLEQFDTLYRLRATLEAQGDYYRQGLMGIESLVYAQRVAMRCTQYGNASDSLQRVLRREAEVFFKDYALPVDQALASAMLTAYIKGLPQKERLQPIQEGVKGLRDVEYFVQTIMPSSLLTSPDRFYGWLDRGASVDELRRDSLFDFSIAVAEAFRGGVGAQLDSIDSRLTPVYRRYVEGLMRMESNREFSPDANSTLRVAYGKVEGYQAREAVYFSPNTTLDGLIEKIALGRHDYRIPPRLDSIYRRKDFGRWAVKGTVPACFIASIHTTGGNSGSPVINARGELIGLNFDRVWEGTMSDIMFDPAKCRNISVDIRFVLFMIEEYGQRPDLLRSMGLGK